MGKKLEDKCRWKESIGSQAVVEGRMKRCKECDGYNKTCGYYIPIKRIIVRYLNGKNNK